MVQPVVAELTSMIRHLVRSLVPFARAHRVPLKFVSSTPKMETAYHPEQIIPPLTQILCRIIAATPAHQEVRLAIHPHAGHGEPTLLIHLAAAGIHPSRSAEILSDLKWPVKTRPAEKSGTLFEIPLPVVQPADAPSTHHAAKPTYDIPVFYRKLRRHMQVYATSIKVLEEAVAQKHSEREQAFLHKVNAIILGALDREDFGVRALSRALALSRTQLYRRLKPLIRLSPAQYIRFVRLQKAKEYLEEGEMTVGEVCFKVGFLDQSHFTRAFYKQFGFNPSLLRKTDHKIPSHE